MSNAVILTHENADFDAVASQLAAHKLDPEAIPILSRRRNRNVKSFLTLYGSVLPFISTDDLPRQQIDRVIVTDSQTYTAVKGMRPTVPIHIIDHHPLARELEPYQRYTGEPLGATTTMLVEQMRVEGITIAPIEATLLMLGIYEDTGSLLHGTTTSRDIMAAAWLLEQGGDLDIVRKFLEHFLTDDQRQLYARLIDGAQSYEIGGFVVLVATASFPHVVEEVSTLAHKIRETYDAHAIMLLVAMEDHVQLVARSTVDEIDVGKIAAHFGGGGHSRAAAAQIRSLPLAEVNKQLIDLLPVVVQPAKRVSDLMSRRVQIIGPDERIEAAALRMARSGHEGYPVADNGKVVGLLTRRAVDRAMGHGLAKNTVREIMESGTVSVHPDDSVEAMQRTMMESGWGQVPVLDESDELIGIVTRTDLLNLLTHREQTVETRAGQIAHQMRETLPAGLVKLLQIIAGEATDQDTSLYIVGGFVRDLLLRLPNTDVDIVVEGDAIALARALHDRYGGEIHTPSLFGTIKWTLNPQLAEAIDVNPTDLPAFIDFVTARREFYEEPAALPTVEQGSIKLDLLRRDFTINTLAIRLAPPPFGRLLDYYGGERDLNEGRIRVLHSLSFIDDATRILRAARFEQRFDFKIESNTLALIPPALPYIHRISGHRLHHEFILIMQEAFPEKTLARLDRLKTLDSIHPRLEFDEWAVTKFNAARMSLPEPLKPTNAADLAHIYWVLLTARLADLDGLIERLTLPAEIANCIRQGQRIYALLPSLDADLKPSEVVRKLKGVDSPALAAGWLMSPSKQGEMVILNYVERWNFTKSSLTGDDLIAMGLPEGPRIGKLLNELQRALLDGEIEAGNERAYAERWLRDNP